MKFLKFNRHNIFAMAGLVVLLFGLVMPSTALAASPATVQAGSDPNHPIALSITAGQDMPETGTLAPGQQVWYVITVNDPNGTYVSNNEKNENAPGADSDKNNSTDVEQKDTTPGLDQPPLNLSLFVTPGNGNSINKVQMNLFQDSYAQQWSAGNIYTPGMDNSAAVAPFGAGSVVTYETDTHNRSTFHGDPNVGELVYGGRMINGQPVLVEIQNGNAFPVSYHLYTAHLTNITL